MILKRGNKYGARIYDPSTGKNVWLGTFDTRREAKEAEADGLRDLKQAKVRTVATCAGFAATWIERFPRPKRSTNIHNAERIRRFVQDFGNTPLDRITRAQARDWALEHRSHVDVVRAMFSDAIRDGLIDSNPFADLRLKQSRGRKDLVVPTPDEVAALIQAARDVHGEYGRRVYANLVQFAAFSGLRAGELFGLRWSDVSLEARTIRVERQWNIKLQEFTTPKNGRARTVFLTDQAREALERTARTRHEEIFRTPNEKLFSGGSVTYWWHPVRAAAGLPGFPFHGLRHHFGTFLAREDVGPVQIKSMMGHADLETTMVYVHMTEQDTLASVARALGHSGPRIVPEPVTIRSQKGPQGA